MKLSHRVQAIEPSATFAIKAAATALRRAGQDVVDLSAGEPDGHPPQGVVEAAMGALRRGEHGYGPVSGLAPLREAIAEGYVREHGLAVSAANVLITFGGKQALDTLAQTLWNPGDEVIVFSPYWVSYLPQIELAGARPVVVPTSPDRGFVPDPARLRAAITPRSRGMILNSPNNPSGAVIDRACLQELMAVARDHDLAVISDEIYAAITYDGQQSTCVPTLSEDAASRTVIVDAVSKTYAMTGWRVGWMVGPEDVVRAASTLQGHSTSGVSRINQAGALAAVRADRSFFVPVLAALEVRRDACFEALEAIPGIDPGLRSGGAFYAFPRVDGLFGRTSPGGRRLDSAMAVADFLIHEGGVAVVPGEAFGEPRCVRISYAIGREQLVQGLQKLAAAVALLA